MNISVDLNVPQILEKVNNKRLGTFIAKTWKDYLDPYTPRDTGFLMQNFSIRPFEIHYTEPYAVYNYYGDGKNFQKKNPYATSHWDKAAEGAGQKDKLIRTVNAALQSGQF